MIPIDPRKLTLWLLLAAVIALAVIAAGSDGAPPAGLPEPGTVLATRNAGGEEANRSPGERNHVALVGPIVRWPDGREEPCVFEAQGPPVDKVIAVPFFDFLARYPDVTAYALVDAEAGRQWAAAAAEQLGRPYQYLRANCVTLLRTSYPGDEPCWRRPDHVAAAGTMIWRKLIPDADFEPLPDPWANATSDPNDLQRDVR